MLGMGPRLEGPLLLAAAGGQAMTAPALGPQQGWLAGGDGLGTLGQEQAAQSAYHYPCQPVAPSPAHGSSGQVAAPGV